MQQLIALFNEQVDQKFTFQLSDATVDDFGLRALGKARLSAVRLFNKPKQLSGDSTNQ